MSIASKYALERLPYALPMGVPTSPKLMAICPCTGPPARCVLDGVLVKAGHDQQSLEMGDAVNLPPSTSISAIATCPDRPHKQTPHGQTDGIGLEFDPRPVDAVILGTIAKADALDISHIPF